MSPNPQQQQQEQQQHDSNSCSNGNLTQPQSQPCPEELEAWLMTDHDTEELENLLGTETEEWKTLLATDAEEWKAWFATEPDNSDTQPTVWTRLQDKVLERALLTCPEGMVNRWERIAAIVPGGKTPVQIRERYEELLQDISLIYSGHYDDLMEELAAAEMVAATTKVDGGRTEHTPPVDRNGRECHWTEEEHRATAAAEVIAAEEMARPVNDNRRECRWTEEEHRLFLVGLEKCGKHWTKISRCFVVTRTPSQVASHAQKYFLRRGATGKNRKRKSIHDITIENNDPISQLHPHSKSQPQSQPVSRCPEELEAWLATELFHDISQFKLGQFDEDDLTEAMTAAEEMAVAEEIAAMEVAATEMAAAKVDGGTTEHTPPVSDNRRERRWTEEEHRLFLVGLEKYGKCWTKISRHSVVTRTPSQVASHAQKYFLRQNVTEKKRKRKSIHDITIENNVSVPQFHPHPHPHPHAHSQP